MKRFTQPLPSGSRTKAGELAMPRTTRGFDLMVHFLSPFRRAGPFPQLYRPS